MTIQNQPQDAVKRNLQLAQTVMQHLYQHPHLLQSLPDDFDLIILPKDDPEMRLFNLELAELDETEYLLRSPKNAERLLAALAWSEAGEGVPQTIEELMAEVGFDEHENGSLFEE